LSNLNILLRELFNQQFFSRQSSHLIEQTACPHQGRSGHSVLHLDPSSPFVLSPPLDRREVDLLCINKKGGKMGPVLERTQQAILNDQFRRSGRGVVLTGGVKSVKDLPGLLEAIKDYNSFNPDNDPWLEHDFGKLSWNGDKVFWKIDYYNESYTE